MSNPWEAPGLSPEERAMALRANSLHCDQQAITAAIRAAVAEEREACARVAEDCRNEINPRADSLFISAVNEGIEAIADRIRTRTALATLDVEDTQK